MKILKIIMVTGLALGFLLMAYAEHDGTDGKHCDYKKHKMQEADANKDGAISRDEFVVAHQERANKMFEEMDANSDGKIDASER